MAYNVQTWQRGGIWRTSPRDCCWIKLLKLMLRTSAWRYSSAQY